MKDSQDWLDEILETEPHRTGLHEDSGNGDPCYCTTKSAIRKHILQEALEIVDSVQAERVTGLDLVSKQMVRNKFNDKYKED